MLNKKIIFMAMLVSLLSLSAVSAAEDATSDILDESVIEDVSNDELVLDEPVGSGDDEPALGDEGNAGTFHDLNETINGNEDSTITLAKNYTYNGVDDYDSDFKEGIVINRSVNIYGNGVTIDGSHMARIFYVNATDVFFHDINFINGYNDGECGAIFGGKEFNAINCTFTNNTADTGGAVGGGNAINCTFTQNIASAGGALIFGNATNCTFINNTADQCAGAVGASYVTNCTFINNTAGEYGGAIYEAYVTNCTFINNTAQYGGAISDGIITNCTFINNTAQYGGAICSYDMEACEVTNCTFTQNTANEVGGAICLGNAINCTFYNNYAPNGGALVNSTAENCTFIENVAANGGAMENSTAENCTFTQNTAQNGGAMYQCDAINCTFTQNIASDRGGAICLGNATNCTFIKNTAIFRGGAIYQGEAINCTFTQNTVDSNFIECVGGAISNGNATNCNFNGNYAYIGGAISNGNAINCSFTQNTATYGGAICEGYLTDCNFTQNTAEWGGAAFYGMATNCNFKENTAKYGGAISNGNATNCSFMLNYATEVGNDAIGLVTENCKFIVPELTASDFKTAYNSSEKFIFTLDANGQVLDGVKTIISIYKNGAFVANYTAFSGEGWTVKLAPGTYQAVLSIPNSNVEAVTKTITVNKAPTAITASAVTATYNANKYLVITLTDSNGKALSGVKVTVTLGSAKVYQTDKNGQIKINVAKLVPKTYTAKIAYAGNANYAAASKSVKVVVKKATPKMTAKAKSFKVSVKTKKYTITLKDNKNKVMKKAKVTLTINKKTFKATTNSKGVATFKITNLKKKGKFTATIKYAGNKYYNKISKKAVITAK